MATDLITLGATDANDASIRRAADALSAGALVAFPTETVYGLGVNAARADSVRRLREVKGRANRQPFTVHIGQRSDYEQFVPAPSSLGRRLARKGWPGPLTLVFGVADPTAAPIHQHLSDEGSEAIYTDRSVGIRFPDHPSVCAMLVATASPIIASSANRTGAPPPETADAVREQLGGDVDLIVDGGPTRYRKASTIVSINGTGYKVVRTGVYDERTIHRLATTTILFVCTGNTCRSPMAEGLSRKMIAERLGCAEAALREHGIVLHSAGTCGGGGGASEHAIDVCRRRGIELGAHRSRPLTPDVIRSADFVFVMGRQHRETVLATAPDAASKTDLLDRGVDITDPAGGRVEDYERIADQIARALEKRVEEVLA